MPADDRDICPACFNELPSLAGLANEARHLTCPRCGFLLPTPNDPHQTASDTPVAKRRTSRPD